MVVGPGVLVSPRNVTRLEETTVVHSPFFEYEAF